MTANPLSNDVKSIVSVDQAWFYRIVPLTLRNDILECLVDENNRTPELSQELEIILGKRINLKIDTSAHIEQMLVSHYPRVQSAESANERRAESYRISVSDNGFLEKLVKEAGSLNSSDIHFETYGEQCRIRFRVDGVLIDRHKISKSEYPTLVNKIKIVASCDIAEKRLPQDGRIRLKFEERHVDIRVSILPTLYGEKIVLRLLGSDASNIRIERLGFSTDELDRYHQAVRKPNGIILISGPTGSGKTTTLYATLKLLNKPKNNILTIEDPIEYTLDGVNQVQLKEQIGLTYTEALRTFLRQDPDIIMLGEIRDAQTAQMAIRAALTGHLVLSTIHTNSAWGTISRLTDMGIPAYLLASTLNLSVAQRLLRVLCKKCKKEHVGAFSELPKRYQIAAPANHFSASGCEACHYTGYMGRRAIYEVVNVTKELSEHIKQNNTNINDYLKAHRIGTLSENAYKLFSEGETSLEEVYPYLLNED